MHYIDVLVDLFATIVILQVIVKYATIAIFVIIAMYAIIVMHVIIAIFASDAIIGDRKKHLI